MTEESVDTDARADKAWLLGVQRKLFKWSRENPEGQYRELWGWIIDPRNLRRAWQTVATRKGKRTPGIDGVTVKHIQRQGVAAFLGGLREELRSGSFVPSPAGRKWIPKPGKPGEFRPLGVPIVKDRVAACAVKQIIEPLFEARFWQVSYGFRPGRGCHGALEHIRRAIRSRKTAEDGKRHTYPCQWAIECDVKSCFDSLSWHQIMERIRCRSTDRKVNRLIWMFLKAGVLAEDQFIRTDAGTPQGANLSPLLANIALEVIEERYGRWVQWDKPYDEGVKAAANARMRDRTAGRPVFFPIRYADDFVVLVSGTYEDALKEKEALAAHLKHAAKLTLSEEKTHITPLEKGFEFLGHKIRMTWDDRYGWSPRIEIPKKKVSDIRYRIKQWTTRSMTRWSLAHILRNINPMLRGWGQFYRHCTGAKHIFYSVDWYVGDRLWRWMRKKYPEASVKQLMRSRRWSTIRLGYRAWHEGRQEQFLMGSLTVERYALERMRRPDYAVVSGEPDT